MTTILILQSDSFGIHLCMELFTTNMSNFENIKGIKSKEVIELIDNCYKF